MTLWDDINNGVQQFGGGWKDIVGTIKNSFNPQGPTPQNPIGSLYDIPSGGGSADVSSAGSSTPAPSGPPVGSTLPAGWGPSQAQPSFDQSMMDSYLHQANTPAMDPALVQQTMQSLQGVKLPDYLQQSKDAYQNVLNQISGIKNGVNAGYDQVNTDMGDMYKANQGAMTMGTNNILTQLAQGEGNAIQGSARANVDALANLKNSELAQRAAVAQKGGMAQAAGDYQHTDPADVAVAGTLANAQQQAGNAQAAATQNTNMNNEMASSLGNQAAIMHQQLENNRLGYNASMGKYQADLANQEATREIEAQKQMYQDALARTQAMYGISKDQASLNIQKNQALYGNKGFLGDGLTAQGTYSLDMAKAAAQQQAAGNVAPDVTALQAYPQFQQEYLKAMQNGMGVPPGTKATASDLVKYGLNDMQGQDPNVLANWAQFAQMASAPKALSDPSLDTYLALQNQ